MNFISFFLLLWSIFIPTTHMIYICKSMYYIITPKSNYYIVTYTIFLLIPFGHGALIPESIILAAQHNFLERAFSIFSYNN